MQITINVDLTANEIKLLNEINNSSEPDDYSFDIDGGEFERLIDLGLVDSVLGEQFYPTFLGEEYLKQSKNK